MTARLLSLALLAVVLSPPAQAQDAASRVGVQWVTTYSFLEHLAEGRAESPFLPARKPLYDKVDKERKAGTTVQNPWGGEGANRFMRVRVRKTIVSRVMKDLRDCLVVPLIGRIAFDVQVLPGSVLLFSPEYVRMGAAGVRLKVTADGQELWSDVLAGKSMYDNSWDEVSIPLDAYAGRKVTIVFEVDKPSLGDKRWTRRGKHKGVGLFALPRIITRVDSKDLEQRAAVKAIVGDELNYNVIMFVFDSGRADLLSPVREERKKIPSITPALDKFGANAVQFSRAYSVGNQTRIGSYSFYTGMPPAAGGFWSIKWGLSRAFRKAFYAQKPVSLPNQLKKAGYLTGHLGFNGFLTGFQYLSLDMGFDFVGEYNGVPENTVRMTDGIIEWVEQHKDQKFFLLVWFDPPHFPYNPPKKYVQRVYDAGLDPSDKFFDHRYLGKMAYGDEYFGKIADKLTQLGLDKKTMYLVSADHGEAMDLRHDGYSSNVNTRIARHHGKSLYDEEVHVPLWVRLDGVLEKRVVSAQVSLMSLGATITDLLGLETNWKGQLGRSFATLVRGGKEAVERLIYFEARWSYGIRWGGYKYIFHDSRERLKLHRKSLWQRARDGTDEIFDAVNDPFELENIATTQPDVRRKMRQTYFNWRAKMRAFRAGQSPDGADTRPIIDLKLEP
ncbi:MAG: arylsulfatase A-like enzyme [Myxococcota bacterium]|jgi:arylsulfatase A-like enzyme